LSLLPGLGAAQHSAWRCTCAHLWAWLRQHTSCQPRRHHRHRHHHHHHPPRRYEGITQKLKWNQSIREPSPPPSQYEADVMAAQQRHEASWQQQDSGYH
jgi:hypothetical protein